ncbi:hypothetical protein [Streptomyces sp. XH2]|uniref:hypothetical protein n=1 Tax=Streptomyces sp. XH2 TaxID=3412483 RepID=UPI003C7BC7D6
MDTAWDHDLPNRPADKRAAFARRLAAKGVEEQQAAAVWAQRFQMPPLDGPIKAPAWGECSRHQLVSACTALVSEGSRNESHWAEPGMKARTVTRAG